ncbi:UPF0481 protein At3g47200-like [Bidens hawaiensis]|uniref:UPF0481 protein At3g47200-like n=1 Tax=Bidens hawaiensis TaxID=980011 RepID=UPI00404B8671
MASVQDQNQGNIEATSDLIFHSISDSARDTPGPVTFQPPSPVRIPRVPKTVRESDDYTKYYVPKVVSIGPYHFGKPELDPVEKLKPHFTMKLLGRPEDLRSLCNKLAEPGMVQELRNFYEENSTTEFSDMDFAKMMLLDACFIYYYTIFIYDGNPERCLELKTSQIVSISKDLLLLENQIPYKVLTESYRKIKAPRNYSLFGKGSNFNYRNVSELVDVGIDFEQSEDMFLSSVEFSKGWLGFSAKVTLPHITVNDSTRHVLLNMIAYETCVCPAEDAWVTPYVCLLDSLIDHADDVKILRKAWVLETSLGSDEEVAKLFNEIAKDLVPINNAYTETKHKIQKHYESWSNTLFSQLKNEYFKSPWAIFVLLGALLGLLFTAIQTYSGLTGECDNLCKFLKKNHHL